MLLCDRGLYVDRIKVENSGARAASLKIVAHFRVSLLDEAR